MENTGTIGVILHPDRFRELLDKEQELMAFKATGAKLPTLQDVEKDVNLGGHPSEAIIKAEVEAMVKDKFPNYTYDGKDYALLLNSKIKVRGILDKLIAHPVYGAGIKAVFPSKEAYELLGSKWLDVKIYKCLYPNPEGEIWTRMSEEFDSKFVAKS